MISITCKSGLLITNKPCQLFLMSTSRAKVGRPKTRPASAAVISVPLSRAERTLLESAVTSTGKSRAETMRMALRAFAASLSLHLYGCAEELPPYKPPSLPVALHIDYAEDPVEEASWSLGAFQWNSAVGREVFVEGAPESDCGVHVVVWDPLLGRDAMAITHLAHDCRVEIMVRPGIGVDRLRVAIEHELGHVAQGHVADDGAHSADRGSVMYGEYVAEPISEGNPFGASVQVIKPEDAARVVANLPPVAVKRAELQAR